MHKQPQKKTKKKKKKNAKKGNTVAYLSQNVQLMGKVASSNPTLFDLDKN
jgi:hypothetical protein